MADTTELHLRIAELAGRLRAGDADAGSEIVSLLDKQVRVRLRHRVPADLFDDVYQETWARFFGQLLKGQEPDNYVAWFLGIARLVSYEMMRREGKELKLDEKTETLLRALIPTLEHEAYVTQLYRRLMYCLGEIPDRYSRFLVGHARGESRDSLCRRVDLAVRSYAKFLYRARKRLMTCLEGSEAT